MNLLSSVKGSYLGYVFIAIVGCLFHSKPGGKIIIPTYINMSNGTGRLAVKFLEMFGASFKRQFDLESYKRFFADMGYENVEYDVVDGRMPCAIAVITKPIRRNV